MAEPFAAQNAIRSAPTIVRIPHIFLDCDGVLADFDTYARSYFGMHPREVEAELGSRRFCEPCSTLSRISIRPS